MPKYPKYEYERDGLCHPTYWRTKMYGDLSVMPHFHSVLELIYAEKGCLETTIRGALYTAHQGELIVVPNFMAHDLKAPEGADVIALVIPLNYLKNFRYILGKKEFIPYVMSVGKATERIVYALKLLMDDVSDNAPSFTERIPYNPQFEYHNSLITQGQISTILGTLLESVPMQDSPDDFCDEAIQKILMYLNQNFDKNISQKTLSASLGYTQSRVSRLFNRSVGISVPQYLNTIRSKAAANILIECGLISNADVLSEAGFDSERTFYRVFKEFFGISPHRFRHLPKTEQERLVWGRSNVSN